MTPLPHISTTASRPSKESPAFSFSWNPIGRVLRIYQGESSFAEHDMSASATEPSETTGMVMMGLLLAGCVAGVIWSNVALVVCLVVGACAIEDLAKGLGWFGGSKA